MNSNSLMDVWSEQDDGRLKLTVLSPLSSQGITSIDNGHEWITYLPDENRVMVESSPRQEETDRTELNRIHLAERNYELNVSDDDIEIAGRSCVQLRAKSKHGQMPERLYGIDKDKGYLLKMEVLAGRESKVMLDTKEIEFPKSIPDDDFELEPHRTARTVPYGAPLTVSIDKGKQIMGFQPYVPGALPYGFVVEAPQVVEGKKGKFMAVRITDGLANATVYEWPESRDTKKHKQSIKVRTAKGLRFQMQGELPAAVQDGLLECFVREALKKVESSLLQMGTEETLRLNRALNSPEEANRETSGKDRSSASRSQFYAIVLIDVEE
jgi:outer membrane lipoprotein-sorting protein